MNETRHELSQESLADLRIQEDVYSDTFDAMLGLLLRAA